MIAPFVTAFSASCSTKFTVAPRPATRAGSSAATVSRPGVDAAATPPLVMTADRTRAAHAAMGADRRTPRARNTVASARGSAIETFLRNRGMASRSAPRIVAATATECHKGYEQSTAGDLVMQ